MKKKFLSIAAIAFCAAVSISAQNPATIVVDGKTFADLNKDGKLQPYEDTRLPNSRRTADLLSRMTVDEKISIVMGTGMAGFEMLSGFDQLNPIVSVDKKDYLLPGSAGTTMPMPKYGLPAIVLTDGPAGIRISPTRTGDTKTYYATGFPVGVALASTWDVDLVEAVGKAMSNEILEYGSDVQLAPALNIMRNPLCGRNFEYYSEDPVIAGKIASAMTQGIQGDGVGVSLKHFAANNSEKNRMGLNVNVSQRALREIYLRGFEIAVKESAPATIMSSYNKINGTYTSADYDLLTTVLRDEWGFRGLVMTDWFGGYSNVSNLSANKDDSPSLAENFTSQQIQAGNDLLMPGIRPQIQNLQDDLKSGKLSERELDICAERVLTAIFASPKMKGYKYSSQPNLEDHAKLTRQVASESMVLLENNGVLPLSTDIKNIALFGSLSYNFVVGGTGSGDVNKAYTIPLDKGLVNAGYKLDAKLEGIYVPFVQKETESVKVQRQKNPFMLIPLMPQPELKESLIKETAKANDVAVITIGRSSGEMDDRAVNSDFYLSQQELDLITKVSEIYHAQGKKVAVIINVGGVIETASWKDKVDAMLSAWLPGQEAGNSVADVLSGKVNPSGRLSMTFPVKYEDIPFSTAADFQGLPLDKPAEVMYKEGIYVGYRYFNTFNVKSAYEFGYGLSYTNFDYSGAKVSHKEFKKEIYVTVDIKNTGSVAGKEVVQLYVSAPKGSVDKPAKELKAFAKTKLLQPGETQSVTLKLTPKDLASFVPQASAWVADQGTYKVEIASSSLRAKQTVTFTVPAKLIVEKVNNVLNNKADFADMKP
ncbi:MAG TPA: glycoside hydrolase family 3 N-terminal domain-containing protein [Dysgonomonas sp.]|uniref:beta-glucosidase n=1 Tax=unclassified Dysgonomonas TaxID=2630389 RepID=UPI0025C0076A|nr:MULTISPECIES: glycoside hydrolase family 3 N-terminal domain-containing protein [unclassified Dysgonomonas]HML65188.1 glycoside hydrolase family 3 N-terminal domain-containing protein [Dysgonomonas sp.]